MKSLPVAFAALALLLVSGCTTYYRVTDPTTGHIYYTTSHSFDQNNNGAASFVDDRTGDKVTIQNSHVATITEDQFENEKKPAAATQP